MTLVTRPVGPEEFRDWYVACEATFSSDVHDDELAMEGGLFEADRSLAVLDGTRIVATAGAFSLDLSVPGGSRPVAGVTMVSVSPTHRRRGLASGLMRRQLTDIHDAGQEAVAALWASEPAIYGRYGYGLASWSGAVDVPTRTATLRSPTDPRWSVRPVDPAGLAPLAAPVHEQTRGRRAGMLRRDERWWARRLADPEHRRGGFSPLRAVVADGPGGVGGYAVYAAKPDWQLQGPEHALHVRELVAVAAGAESALWQFLLQHDLVGTLTARELPVDTALLHLLLDPRRAAFRVLDNLWVRLVDVRRALAERTYAVDGRIVIEVRDDVCDWNAGRLSLEVVHGAADVSVTADPPTITTGAAELGAVYLGGTSLTSLAAAGRVEAKDPTVLSHVDAMFRTAHAPYCPEVF